MPTTAQTGFKPTPIGRFMLAGMLVWTLVVGLSLAWNINQLKGQAEYLATEEARSNWNKDLAFRRWATRHGGLYVKPGARTPPNPYLAHLPNRDVETTDGMKLTLMNPAYMMRQMTDEFEDLYGVKGKITSQVLTNPINKADPWELEALKRFDQGETEITDVEELDGEAYLRLMRPLVMKEGCVKCHGHLGFKVGDIRGGVSVSIPLAPYQAAAAKTARTEKITYGGVWLLGLMGIAYVARRGKQFEDDRQQAQESLIKSAREWTYAMDFFEDAVYLIDLEDKVIRANRAFYTLTGLTPGQTIGQDVSIIMHSGSKVISCPVCAARHAIKDTMITMEADDPNNCTGRPIEVTVKIIRDDADKPIGVLMGIHDLTRARKTEAVIVERQAQIKDLLESTAEAIYGLDLEGNCTFANSACLLMLGYKDISELIGCNMHQLILYAHSDKTPYPESECKIYLASRKGTKVHTSDEIMWRADGSSFPVEYWSYPVLRNGELVGAVVTFFDISDRLQNEEALRRSQKMDAIGQLSGGIAHDFNNQLGVIIGYLDFLRMHTAKEEEPGKWVDTATRATLRCMDLTRQLLAFSRRQARTRTVTDLNTSIRELEAMIARSITPEVEVQFFLAGVLWLTEIDPGEFQDVILNLVINARDAMPGGGKLVIETSNKHLDEDFTALNPEIKAGDYVQLTVSDSGTGMTKETLEHIFEPFFTTKLDGKGTGLGMAMVYGFVKRYGGCIKIYSEPGVGTNMRLYLPRSTASDTTELVNTHDEINLPTGNESILIVDDEADLLQVANYYLSTQGYRTQTAENGAQALSILEGDEPIDLLFSDVVMPGGMDGYELAQRATELRPGLRVLLTSGFTSKTTDQEEADRFSTRLLAKPYRRKDLVLSVQRVLGTAQADANHATRRTILIVDDEENIRDLFKINLDKLGYKVVMASQGDEAIALYTQAMSNNKTIDAVILDLSLRSGMGGKEVAEKIRALHPQARIIVSSGHTSGPEMTDCKAHGFDAAMDKTFDREIMKNTLLRVFSLPRA